MNCLRCYAKLQLLLCKSFARPFACIPGLLTLLYAPVKFNVFEGFLIAIKI